MRTTLLTLVVIFTPLLAEARQDDAMRVAPRIDVACRQGDCARPYRSSHARPRAHHTRRYARNHRPAYRYGS